jgi:hydrogenase nickel incorporation protein HypA/HybF
MHELGIARSILNTVREEANRWENKRVAAVGVQLGELSGVNPEALEFAFKSIVKDTVFESIELHIESTPRRHQCTRCSRAFDVLNHRTECTQCGERQTRLISGDEIEIAYLEIEE